MSLILLLIQSTFAQQKYANDNVYRALARQPSDIGILFCSNLLATTSLIGVLDTLVYLPVYTTETDNKHNEDATVYKSKGTKTIMISTYSSQKRTSATGITMPFPSYIQQYPPSRVTSVCSCIVTDIPTYTQYRYCDAAEMTITYTTATYTVSASGPHTVTSTYTDTKTRYM